MLTACAGSRAGDVPPAFEAFQGTWAPVYAETDGKAAPAKQIEGIRVVFSGESYSVRVGDQVVHEGSRVTVDPAASPSTVDDAFEGGHLIRGLYRIEGDTMLSCVGAMDGERPEAFGTKAGSGRTLRILRRVRAEDDPKGKAIAEEQARFEGTWRFESLEMGDLKLPAAKLESSSMVCKDDTFTMTDGQATYRGRYVVDPTASPKTIDVIFTEGPNAGTIARGVYTLEGDTYAIAVGMAGTERPAKVEAGPGGHAFEVLKKKQP
jgi:uncharacterized protein (TIGR03067 family)